LKGELFIEFENETVAIKQHQGITVPKGILHRPYVKEPTAVIMVEKDTVVPVGDK
jgi:mannose-6-phosphate isomerase-like protein (cupin superfamily)